MISVIIPTSNSAAILPRCFDGLIPGVVRGIVREVVVADGGSSDETLAIADAAGAHVVKAGSARGDQMLTGGAAAKSDWLLFLHPETALEAGWENEAESFAQRVTLERPRAGVFRFALDDFEPSSRRTEMFAAVRSSLLGQPSGRQGLLIPKRLYLKIGGHRSAPMEDIDLVRRIGRSRLVMLRSRAINKIEWRPSDARNVALGLLHALRVPKSLVAFIAR
jgi:glycosyltransferase involved in cell wall biosynthesis